MVEHAVFLGSFEEVRVRLVGGELVKAVAQNDGGTGLTEGTPVSLHLAPEALRVLRVDPDAEVVVSDPEAVAAA